MVAALLTGACSALQAAAGQGEGRREDAVDTVRAREIAFAQTMADRDLEAFAGFISPEAVFFGSEVPLRGREAIVAAWKKFFVAEQAPFSWHPDTVEVLASGHLALTSGPVFDRDGKDVGRFNTIWRLDPGGRWRVVFDKGS
ncbi:DUF4440 domain-containing protein [bacterium CG17_big_fil_post_rev_8_21_14_2_50_64_8]|nr:MAG: DUF4440 domain-containing protein [bacterium CG17_big_fil_post_rev_8_21_14_2_50_64_8]PJA75857.1 MAG: DUF4440 domain-containing protein [bacterium CG_4_9_14_3_um_filter_65_15]